MSDEKMLADRLAPGALRLVQEFLNTPASGPTSEERRIADAVRREGEAGASRPGLAAKHGVSQALVSAILRGKRLSENGAVTLGTRQSTCCWLTAHGFPMPDGRLSVRYHARILELQRVLLSMALANAVARAAEHASHKLDRIALETPFVAAFSRGGPTLRALRPADAFSGAIIGAVYNAMRDGTWARLKACPADRCQHVFFDTSRNRTSTWCSMSICGNRAKVRNYQLRRRAARTP